jgi:hypothetical protein
MGTHVDSGIIVGWASEDRPRRTVRVTLELPEDIVKYLKWNASWEGKTSEDEIVRAIRDYVRRTLDREGIDHSRDVFDLAVEEVPDPIT